MIISTDISNAFNSRNRAQILSALYDEVKLAPLWRLADWSYGTSSPLLLMSQGKLILELLSSQGVKQGDALGSLLYCVSAKDISNASILGLNCRAVSIMDDIYFLGPRDDTFKALARFDSTLKSRHTGLTLNIPKSRALILLAIKWHRTYAESMA